MNFKLDIGPWSLTISNELFRDLEEAINAYNSRGYQDGWAKSGRVHICEVAQERATE